MATLTIRGVTETTRQKLKARAAQHNHSMEAEMRDILDVAVRPEADFIGDWLEATAKFRIKFDGDGADFEPPDRSAARAVKLE